MSGHEFPEPSINPITEPFWEGLRNHRLTLQECTECGEVHYPPEVRCIHCFSRLEWTEVDGTGTIYSYGIVHHPNHPDYFTETPFVLGLVELKEGPKIVTNIVDCDVDDIDIGREVEIAFGDVTHDLTVPQFTLVE